MIALDRASRAAVDGTAEAALAKGGSEPRPARDLGFMYNRTIADPDGHRWEPFVMDMAVVPQQQQYNHQPTEDSIGGYFIWYDLRQRPT